MTVIFTWLGAAKPCSRTLLMTMAFYTRFYIEREDANDYVPCSNGEDEKVFHRRSNSNETVSAAGKNFRPKRSIFQSVN